MGHHLYRLLSAISVRRRLLGLLLAGVSSAALVFGLSGAAPAMAAGTTASRPEVQLGDITCSLYTEPVKTDSIYGRVTCTSPVDKIVLVAWGEDYYGDTTWNGADEECDATAQCSEVWKGDPGDYSQTVCGTTEWAGIIKGDCQTQIVGTAPPGCGIRQGNDILHHVEVADRPQRPDC